jgi:hypothetical protein
VHRLATGWNEQLDRTPGPDPGHRMGLVKVTTFPPACSNPKASDTFAAVYSPSTCQKK